MGKRDGNKFDRVEKDFYGTLDPACLVPEFVNRIRGTRYAEPCYGNGDLEDLLMDTAECVWRSDVRETVGSSLVLDATKLTKADLRQAECIITNPPYKWDMLKPLLDHLPTLKSTWFLLHADYMHNIRMGPCMKKCCMVIAIGRMYWLPNKIKGYSNMCWYNFVDHPTKTVFIGREA